MLLNKGFIPFLSNYVNRGEVMLGKVEVTQGSQRNSLDVATELTIYTAEYNGITDSEDFLYLLHL